jgi:hypothetical protein
MEIELFDLQTGATISQCMPKAFHLRLNDAPVGWM